MHFLEWKDEASAAKAWRKRVSLGRRLLRSALADGEVPALFELIWAAVAQRHAKLITSANVETTRPHEAHVPLSPFSITQGRQHHDQ